MKNFQWPWIARTTYQQLARTTDYLRNQCAIAARDEDILQMEVRTLRDQIQRALSEVADAREQAARAEGKMLAANAYTDMLRVRVNELTVERNGLMLKIVPGLELITARIERDPAMTHTGSGVAFEDIGDAAAALHGYPPPEQIRPGMAGPDPIPAPPTANEFDAPLAEAGIDLDPGGPSDE